MGLKSLVGQIWQDKATVAYRPSQIYTTAIGTYVLFNITGPVLITLLGGREVAVDGAEDIDLTINGVATDFAGAVAINGGVNWLWVSCLNVAGTLVNAAGVPLTDALLHSKGFVSGIQPAAVGTITAIFATGISWTGDIFCVYRKLSPTSQILVA